MPFGLETNSAARPARNALGFTLIELMAAGAVFILILALTLGLVSALTRIISQSRGSISTFQEARTAFEAMNRMLSQAVLNTYWDYDDPANPTHYLRASELHFVLGPSGSLTGLSQTAGSAAFFQAPLSLTSEPILKSQSDLLNAIGFYVRYSESDDLPAFLSAKKSQSGAWRLWLFVQPTEGLTTYQAFSGSPQAASTSSWFQGALAIPTNNHILANNIILLLIRAGYPDASGNWKESFVYNSRGSTVTSGYPQAPEIHQVPPELRITLVAIDQRTADRLNAWNNQAAYQLLPAGLFLDAADYQEDLLTLKGHLDGRPLGGIPIGYRIFETAVNVSSSKWSR